jgi:hypothetical protein
MNRRRPWRWLLGFALLVAAVATPVVAQQPDLTPEDRAHVAAAQRLIADHGATAWPEFSSPPPILLRAESGEFLIGYPDPPAGFVPVAGLEIAGEPVFYADEPLTPAPIASNWPVGDRWAAALPVRDVFQAILDEVLGEATVTLDETNHVRVLVHEMFHAFQLNRLGGPQKLPSDLTGPAGMDWLADITGSEMAALDAAHVREGSRLRAALEVGTEDEARALAAEFVQLRQERRATSTASYAPDLLSYERSVEWIEGPARFVELALIQHAPEIDQDGALSALVFQDPDVVWAEFLDQLADPGAIPGGIRERYTAMGAGQAFLLDRLLPGWQVRVLDDGLALEDVLAEVTAPDR